MDVGPSWYNLAEASSTPAPKTVTELENLLRSWSSSNNDEWLGKLYVASTIWYDEGESAFLQNGCSPNYRGGLWTLACCKHNMRSAERFKEQVKSGQNSVMILTLSKASGLTHQQYLVSAAKVTAWFETMRQYEAHLLQLSTTKLLGEKLSNRRRSTGLGRHFGDCHTDGRGRVANPNKPHVHAHKAGRDLDGTHLILVSDCFEVWNRPILRVKKTLRQSRYGINISPGNLHQLLIGT